MIDRALTRLVPSPYRAMVDSSVPASTVLTWTASSDWLRALHEATLAAGLRVRPLFEAGVLEVLPAPAQSRTAAVPASATDERVLSVSVAIPPTFTAARVTAIPTTKVDATSGAAPQPSATPMTTFVLVPGQRIDVQFNEWSKREGWSLLWTSEKSWLLPGTSSVAYEGPVDAAIAAAVRDLYGNGVPVRLDIWEANKVMEVSHAK